MFRRECRYRAPHRRGTFSGLRECEGLPKAMAVAPKSRPVKAGRKANLPHAAAPSTAGRSRLKTAAAVITPAAALSSIAPSPEAWLLPKNTVAAPRAVPKKGRAIPRKAIQKNSTVPSSQTLSAPQGGGFLPILCNETGAVPPVPVSPFGGKEERAEKIPEKPLQFRRRHAIIVR